jgi:hypothetical protein
MGVRKNLSNIAEWEQHFLSINKIEEYEKEIGRLFGSVSNGFITSSHNLHTIDNTGVDREYGWKGLFKNIKPVEVEVKKHGKAEKRIIENLYIDVGDFNEKDPVIKSIRNTKGKKARLQKYELGVYSNEHVFTSFKDLCKRQNENGCILRNEGKYFFAKPTGRFCDDKKYRTKKLVKKVKKNIGRIDDAILLTLTTYQPSVEKIMPKNTNLTPVAYAICNIGEWVSSFLKALRAYQQRHGVAWEYVGYTLEMQDNGFPHVHIIFRGSWIGKIEEIAALWKYSDKNGVDYMNKRKLERKTGRKVKGIHLVNYICGYVAKSSQGAIVNGLVNMSWAFAAFFGIRSFNLSHAYKESVIKGIIEKVKSAWRYVGKYNLAKRIIEPLEDFKSEFAIIESFAPWRCTNVT